MNASTSSQSAAQETRPIPPRYWWLKRLGAAAAVWLLLLVGVRWWWGWEAERRLAARLAEYRAAGEPLLPEDFRVDPVPDDENAGLLLQRAAFRITFPAGVPQEAIYLSYNPCPTEQEAQQFDALLQANQAVLALVRQARAKPRSDWGVGPPTVAFPAVMPQLTPQRQLARLTNGAALRYHLSGDDAAAVEALRDELGIGRHVGNMAPLLIPYLVRLAIDALAISSIETIGHDLRVTSESASRDAGPGPATRAQVMALIADLLDEAELRQNWVAVMRGERMDHLFTVRAIQSGTMPRSTVAPPATSPLGFLVPPGAPTVTLPERICDFALSPAMALDAIRIADRTTALTRAGLAPNWVVSGQLMPPTSSPQGLAESMTRELSSILMPPLEQMMSQHFRALASRRMAAIALAIRLYEVDHGCRPTVLEELVPGYLVEVPRDPFDGADGQIRYLADAPSPLLYSVYLNGTDDADASAGPSTQSMLDWPDWPFYLNGDRPSPRPTSRPFGLVRLPLSTSPTAASQQTADNHDNVENAQGDEPGE